jgi:hypothetical protein
MERTRFSGLSRGVGIRFIVQGMESPTPRMQMLDGFNEGWIEFEISEAGARKGEVSWRLYSNH